MHILVVRLVFFLLLFLTEHVHVHNLFATTRATHFDELLLLLCRRLLLLEDFNHLRFLIFTGFTGQLGVRFFVLLPSGRGDEACRAEATGVGALPGVDPLVGRAVNLLDEGLFAESAAMSAVVFVHVHVHL